MYVHDHQNERNVTVPLEWVLMDYVNVVVHVFQKQVREFYDIEGLWGDAKFTTIESSVNQ